MKKSHKTLIIILAVILVPGLIASIVGMFSGISADQPQQEIIIDSVKLEITPLYTFEQKNLAMGCATPHYMMLEYLELWKRQDYISCTERTLPNYNEVDIKAYLDIYSNMQGYKVDSVKTTKFTSDVVFTITYLLGDQNKTQTFEARMLRQNRLGEATTDASWLINPNLSKLN